MILNPCIKDKDKEKEKAKESLDKEPFINTTVLHDDSKWFNISIVFLVLFLSESARGLVSPTISLYVEKMGGSATFLGLVISFFSLGRFLSTIILGYLSAKLRYKKVFIGSVFICVIGAFLYCFAYIDHGYLGMITLLLSRFLLGFGAGTLSVVRAYFAEISSQKQRTTYIAWSNAIQFLGFATTPILGSLLTFIPMFYIEGPVLVGPLTSPGWILTIFNGLLFLILIFLFSNPIPKSKAILPEASSKSESSEHSEISIFKVLIQDRQTLKSLVVFIILNFFIRAILGIYETLGTPIFILLGGTDHSSGFFFGGIGCIGIVVLLSIGHLSRKQIIDDFWILVVGNVVIIIGCSIGISTQISFSRLIPSSILIYGFGYPLAQTIVVSLFSKTISSSIGSKSQGSLMGIIGAAGSLGRILGPLLSGLMFKDDTYTLNIFLFATFLSIVSFFVSFLVMPPKIKENLKCKFKDTSIRLKTFKKVSENQNFIILNEESKVDNS